MLRVILKGCASKASGAVGNDDTKKGRMIFSRGGSALNCGKTHELQIIRVSTDSEHLTLPQSTLQIQSAGAIKIPTLS